MAAMESVHLSPSAQLSGICLKLLRAETAEDFGVAEAGLTEVLSSLERGSDASQVRLAATLEAEIETVFHEIGLPSSFLPARLVMEHLAEGPAMPCSCPASLAQSGILRKNGHVALLTRACKAALALTVVARTLQDNLFLLTKFKGSGVLWNGKVAPRAAQRAVDIACNELISALLAACEPVRAMIRSAMPFSSCSLVGAYSYLIRNAQAANIMVCRMKGWRDLSDSGNATLAATTEALMDLGVLMGSRKDSCSGMEQDSIQRELKFHEVFGGMACFCGTQSCPYVGTMPWTHARLYRSGHMPACDGGDEFLLPNQLDEELMHQGPRGPGLPSSSPALIAAPGPAASADDGTGEQASQGKKLGKKSKKGKVVRKKGKKGK
ncbi:hypothetical protein FNF31_04388 [Cafeteria roenbergensis]|uniref:Uncharacterized protein n=1 Tax=Cafeteria roenbergensis TaxID=33653 RepID=A0A5A8D8Y1_CAFRO|nr:hypothetical protein FNF31_04388 [Cafeteria roenbergensis]